MVRIVTAAGLAVFIGIVAMNAGAQAQTAPSGIRMAQAQPADVLATPRSTRRARLRVYPRDRQDPDGVYPRYFPGRNAVRECSATYVQEYRPSGTVIVPRMNCYWRRG
jgi:hypothetical protein